MCSVQGSCSWHGLQRNGSQMPSHASTVSLCVTMPVTASRIADTYSFQSDSMHIHNRSGAHWCGEVVHTMLRAKVTSARTGTSTPTPTEHTPVLPASAL